MQLNWTNGAGALDGVWVYQDGFIIVQLGPQATSHLIDGLSPATTYCYQVRAFNQAGSSAPSNTACARTADED